MSCLLTDAMLIEWNPRRYAGVQSKEMLVLVAVNHQFKNKVLRCDFGRANRTFENVDVSIEELATLVRVGYGFCAQHRNGNRKSKNFTVSGMLAVDIDHGLRIETALEHPFVKEYGGFIYTTANHSEDAHRFRIVFELEQPIDDPLRMEQALTGLISKVGGDTACTDACRYFFGSAGASVTFINQRLSSAEVDALVMRGSEREFMRETVGTKGKQTATVRSNVRLSPETMVVDTSGHSHRLVDLPVLTGIHCPVHIDHRPSALTIKSGQGTPGVHCKACKATFYIDHVGRYYNFDYSVNVLRHKTYEEWELEQNDDLDLFEPSIRRRRRGVHFISERFLPAIDTAAQVVLVKSPKGSGKTEWLTHVVAEAKRKRQSVLLIGHRQSLIMATAKRLGLTAYIRIVDDPNTGRSIVDHVRPTPYYAICVDSIPSRLDPTSDRYDIVIVDEAEQVIAHLTASTLRDDRRAAILYLGLHFKRAERLYLLDADLNRVTATTLPALIGDATRSYLFLVNDWVEKRGSIHLYKSKNQLAHVLHEHLSQGRRCFVCANSKRLVDRLKLTLEEQFRETKKLKLITSDNSKSADAQDFLLALPASMLEYDGVFVSPALGTGVDITFPEAASKVDSVFGFFQGRINTHFDIDQQLCRVRHPGSVHVWVSPQKHTFETHPEILRREVLDAAQRELGVIELNDDGTPKPAKVDQVYSEVYSEVKALQRASKNNLRENFCDLRRANGWDIIEVETNAESSKSGKVLVERGTELAEEQFIRLMCEAPEISSEQYADLRNRSERSTLLDSERAALSRYEIEHFYRREISPELIDLDNDRKYRRAVRLFELITRSEAEVRNEAIYSKAQLTVDREEPLRRRRLLVDLFTAAGVFSESGVFDRDRIVTHDGLGGFAAAARNLNVTIQELLDRTVRADITQRPAQQLGDLLKLVGLSLSKQKTQKSGDRKIYLYRIDAKALDDMLSVVATRRCTSVNAEWNRQREERLSAIANAPSAEDQAFEAAMRRISQQREQERQEKLQELQRAFESEPRDSDFAVYSTEIDATAHRHAEQSLVCVGDVYVLLPEAWTRSIKRVAWMRGLNSEFTFPIPPDDDCLVLHGDKDLVALGPMDRVWIHMTSIDPELYVFLPRRWTKHVVAAAERFTASAQSECQSAMGE